MLHVQTKQTFDISQLPNVVLLGHLLVSFISNTDISVVFPLLCVHNFSKAFVCIGSHKSMNASLQNEKGSCGRRVATAGHVFEFLLVCGFFPKSTQIDSA